MTSIINDVDETCGDCRSYIVGNGACNHCLSDHYQHLLGEDHPACEEFDGGEYDGE